MRSVWINLVHDRWAGIVFDIIWKLGHFLDHWMYSFFRFSASSLAVILRQFALSPSYAADEQITQGLSPS